MFDTSLLGMVGLTASLSTREVEADNRLKVILCYMGSLSLVCSSDFDSNNKSHKHLPSPSHSNKNQNPDIMPRPLFYFHGRCHLLSCLLN